MTTKRRQIHAGLIRLRDRSTGSDKTLLRRAVDEWEKMSRTASEPVRGHVGDPDQSIYGFTKEDNPRSAEGDLQDLIKRYDLQPLGEEHIRSREEPCDECEDDRWYETCGVCAGSGVHIVRSNWVNATDVYRGEVEDYTVVVMKFPSHVPDQSCWFSVRLYDKPFLQDPVTLKYDRPNQVASSTTYHGQFAGSAIPRVPDSLRGFVYRTSTEEHGDAYVLPDDIVQHFIRMERLKTSE